MRKTDDENWDGVRVKQGPDPEQRLAELKAKAPATRKAVRQFARVYLDTATKAYAAMNCPKAMVWAWLVHRTWKRQSQTVAVPNADLAKLGVSPDTKVRALRQLEYAGIIEIDWRPHKTPLVTLL